MLLIQVLMVLFAVFTMTRVLRQFHRRDIRLGECLAWTAFWAAAGILVLVPDVTQWFAHLLGVGRGADAVFYVTLVALCYFCFRLHLKTRDLDQQMTHLVRKLALEQMKNSEHR